MSWIQARHYGPTWRKSVDLVVIHSTESPRRRGGARSIARWFGGVCICGTRFTERDVRCQKCKQRVAQPPAASAHYIVDNAEVIQCVSERNEAWAAPGANPQGIQIELVGYARHTAEQWRQGGLLARTTTLVAAICKRWNIPVELVSSAELLAACRGITTHASVSQAWHRSTHWDPGPGFPIGEFLGAVRAASGMLPLRYSLNAGGEAA